MRLTRRRFAWQVAAASGGAVLALRAEAEEFELEPEPPAIGEPSAPLPSQPPNSDLLLDSHLELRCLHTGESLAADLCGTAGAYEPSCLLKFDRLLRDHRNNEVHAIDRNLFAQLLALPRVLGVRARYEVISGYRSPQTNTALRAAGHGVATRSMHLEGRAIDVRLLGVDCARLRDAALAAGRGGVGYYERNDFVHLDTGRVRTWTG